MGGEGSRKVGYKGECMCMGRSEKGGRGPGRESVENMCAWIQVCGEFPVSLSLCDLGRNRIKGVFWTRCFLHGHQFILL